MAFIYCVYFITQNAALKSCIFKCFYKNKWHPVISAFFWKHLVTWCSTTIGDWPQPWWSGYPSYCMQCSVMNHGDIRKSYCVMANTPLEIVSGVVVFDPIWRPSPVSVRAMSVIVIQPGHLLICLHTTQMLKRAIRGRMPAGFTTSSTGYASTGQLFTGLGLHDVTSHPLVKLTWPTPKNGPWHLGNYTIYSTEE